MRVTSLLNCDDSELIERLTAIKMKTFVLDPDRIARGILRATDTVWRSAFGGGEPMTAAWRRLFGERMPSVPILFHCVEYEGDDCVVRLYQKGRVTMHDSNGQQIRTRSVALSSEDLQNALEVNRSRIDAAAVRFLRQST
jgi:hypothetical protein